MRVESVWMIGSIWQSKQEDPYVNLCLGILNQARLDYGTKYRRDGEKSMGNNCPDNMWGEFMETLEYKEGLEQVDSFEVACAIGAYLGVK